MLIGYILIAALSIGVVAFSLLSLQRINALNSEIVKVAVPMQEAGDKMRETLLEQDKYEKKYLILQGADMRNLFHKCGAEFEDALATLQKNPGDGRPDIDAIKKLHDAYNALFLHEVILTRAGNTAGAVAVSNGELQKKFEKILVLVQDLSAGARQSKEAGMKRISKIGAFAFFATAVLCTLAIVLGVVSSMVVTHHIFSSINKLTAATKYIAEGDFHYDPHIHTEDEIGTLAQAFLSMGKRLGKLEEMYLDASPLTRLPGGIAIEKALKHRIDSGDAFAFCVIDLDNFKAFNDHYGYAHGNKVIKETAKIIETATKEKGTIDDFVGHIGGDDFVVITTPKDMPEICNQIIALFDARAPSFYTQEDREKGYIFGKSRQGKDMQFPLITISIAVVTNAQRRFTNPIEASEIAAELKDYAKSIPTSLYVVDKRRST
ncbi:MAG TPA: diguanylate cyclase [Nitrospirota bacterium]|nr:diguanylate cyclase [Nitrospirota bacterium]